ncbi:hypothetical protein FUT69_00510 [Xylella taiwanensis]|uniref:Uncharacterized protein n=2 Tax=Xylella taiwanensis TaxID=1444770 RepID=A0ABS8TWY9_9GAMM|nr:hypothetical protein [Xylella taiwanensis]MCD8456213.1 hypothetical protein [Xylella taiwanensis]MCD8458621.1 hypothetical protein [Xylella taiwanensis]MCD8460756.1 hypothetical protein [Xylella taiwanensis]MCD8463185.1 hypothetical protein [Xylella taiwanensis]MCD8465262.1 hypothetical protein [Xylella taiwanensis]
MASIPRRVRRASPMMYRQRLMQPLQQPPPSKHEATQYAFLNGIVTVKHIETRVHKIAEPIARLSVRDAPALAQARLGRLQQFNVPAGLAAASPTFGTSVVSLLSHRHGTPSS